MHLRISVRSLALSALLMAFTTSCQFLAPSIEPQLTDAREIHEQLASDWADIQTVLDRAERDLVAFEEHQVDLGESDLIALYNEISADSIVYAESSSDARANVAAISASFQISLEAVNAKTRAELERLLRLGRQLRQQLVDDLPALLPDVIKRAGGMAVEMAKLQVTADQTLSVAAKSPLVSKERQLALDSDYAALGGEIEAIIQLGDHIVTEGVSLGQRLSSASNAFTQQIATIGK